MTAAMVVAEGILLSTMTEFSHRSTNRFGIIVGVKPSMEVSKGLVKRLLGLGAIEVPDLVMQVIGFAATVANFQKSMEKAQNTARSLILRRQKELKP